MQPPPPSCAVAAASAPLHPQVQISRTPGLTLEHTCFRVESLEDADVTLSYARSRSCNWGHSHSQASTHSSMVPLPNFAHAFVRVLLVHNKTSCMSALHVVDLAGAHPPFFVCLLRRRAALVEGQQPISTQASDLGSLLEATMVCSATARARSLSCRFAVAGRAQSSSNADKAGANDSRA